MIILLTNSTIYRRFINFVVLELLFIELTLHPCNTVNHNGAGGERQSRERRTAHHACDIEGAISPGKGASQRAFPNTGAGGFRIAERKERLAGRRGTRRLLTDYLSQGQSGALKEGQAAAPMSRARLQAKNERRSVWGRSVLKHGGRGGTRTRKPCGIRS